MYCNAHALRLRLLLLLMLLLLQLLLQAPLLQGVMLPRLVELLYYDECCYG